jgi:aquaporin Z
LIPAGPLEELGPNKPIWVIALARLRVCPNSQAGGFPGKLDRTRKRMEGDMALWRRLLAECAGTFWLVFGGCGSAVIAAGFPEVGIGLLGVALAFGLTVLTGAYALGPVSGGHFNPAVSLGLCVAGRFPMGEVAPYALAQVAGALLAALFLLMIATGSPSFDFATSGLAQNGYGAGSPGGYSATSAFLIELVLTGCFIMIILGATARGAPAGFAPIAIGLALTLIHLISIPVTNTSVNPARSTGPALLVGGLAFAQLWMFWLAPLLGGAAGGLLWRFLFEAPPDRA